MLRNTGIAVVTFLVATGSLVVVSTSITSENARALVFLLFVIWMACSGVIAWLLTTSSWQSSNIPTNGLVTEDGNGIRNGAWFGRFSGYNFYIFAHSAVDFGRPGYVSFYFYDGTASLDLRNWPQELHYVGELPPIVIKKLGKPENPDDFFEFIVGLGVNRDELTFAWPKDPTD